MIYCLQSWDVAFLFQYSSNFRFQVSVISRVLRGHTDTLAAQLLTCRTWYRLGTLRLVHPGRSSKFLWASSGSEAQVKWCGDDGWWWHDDNNFQNHRGRTPVAYTPCIPYADMQICTACNDELLALAIITFFHFPRFGFFPVFLPAVTSYFQQTCVRPYFLSFLHPLLLWILFL